MVLLVEALDPVQDRDRLDQRGLIDEDRLEAALQGGVLLDVFAVLVERGRANALDLTAGQRGLENVGGIDRAFRGASAHQRVELVDEEDDLPAGTDLVENLLQALLELAAVLRARAQRAHVERQHTFAAEGFRDVAEHDLLGETLGDCRLANARLADQRRVVLGPPREDLHHPLDLGLTTDDGVERVLGGEVGEVAAELVEQRGLGRLLGGRRLFIESALVEQTIDLATDLLEVGAQVFEDVGRDPLALDQKAKEQVLGADVVVTHPAGFLERDLDDLLDPRGGDDLLDDDPLVAAQHRLDGGADLVDLHPEVVQHLGGEAFALAQQPKEQMLRADI